MDFPAIGIVLAELDGTGEEGEAILRDLKERR